MNYRIRNCNPPQSSYRRSKYGDASFESSSPIAIGSLWVAQRGSHGYAIRCDFDRNGEFATFQFSGSWVPNSLWYGQAFQSPARSTLKIVNKFLGSRSWVPILGLGDSTAISVVGKGKYELNRWNSSPAASDKPIVFEVPIAEGYALHSIEPIDGLTLCFFVGPTDSRLILLDPISGKLLDTVELSLNRGSIASILENKLL